jgi:hypothetical protein
MFSRDPKGSAFDQVAFSSEKTGATKLHAFALGGGLDGCIPV